MTHVLRLCLLALALMAGITAASWSTCPIAPTGYENLLWANCTEITACSATACTCMGGTLDAQGHCSGTFNKTCTQTTACVATYMSCLSTAADTLAVSTTASTACKDWGTTLHTMEVAAAASPDTFNTTVVYKACQAMTCQIFNDSVTDGSCTSDVIPYSSVCVPTPTAAPTTTKAVSVTRVTITLTGNWSYLLNNASAQAAMMAALSSDLSAYYGYPVVVTAITVVSSTRRLAGDTLKVEFTVYATEAATQSKSDTLKTNLVLTAVKAEYTAATGLPATSIGVSTVVVAPDSEATNPPGGAASATATLFSIVIAIVVALMAL